MNEGKRIVLSFLLVFSDNLQGCRSQISEEYYYGSFENFTEDSVSTQKPLERQQIHLQHATEDPPKPLSAGKTEMKRLFQNMEKKKHFPKLERKKFFQKKANSTKNETRRYAYDMHYQEKISRVFYEWVYSKETFHGADIPGLLEYDDQDERPWLPWLLWTKQKNINYDWQDAQLLNDGKTRYSDKLGQEKYAKIAYYGDQKQTIFSCYFISTTFQNAIDDLRHYYSLRYLYLNNLHYEVGYVVQEIVQKYSVVLEMFHTMQQKYYHRTEHSSVVPSSYMFYMYTQILFECKQIIHLCNMLEELENKYKNRPDTIFVDYKERTGLELNADGSSPRGDGRAKYTAGLAGDSTEEKNYKAALDKLALYRETERQRRLNETKKNHRNLIKWGVYKSTEMSKKPRHWGHFPRIYGWSIEYW